MSHGRIMATAKSKSCNRLMRTFHGTGAVKTAPAKTTGNIAAFSFESRASPAFKTERRYVSGGLGRSGFDGAGAMEGPHKSVTTFALGRSHYSPVAHSELAPTYV